jgi:hypothetical protein
MYYDLGIKNIITNAVNKISRAVKAHGWARAAGELDREGLSDEAKVCRQELLKLYSN